MNFSSGSPHLAFLSESNELRSSVLQQTQSPGSPWPASLDKQPLSLMLKETWQTLVSLVRFPRRESLHCAGHRGAGRDTRAWPRRARAPGISLQRLRRVAVTCCQCHCQRKQDIIVTGVTHTALYFAPSTNMLQRIHRQSPQLEKKALHCSQEEVQICCLDCITCMSVGVLYGTANLLYFLTPVCLLCWYTEGFCWEQRATASTIMRYSFTNV